MISLSLTTLFDYLQSKDLKPELQQETNQIYVIFKFNGKDFPLFLRIFEGDRLLQLLTFLPTTFKPTQASEIARLLHYLNKELDLPGFCIDEISSLIFYRFMIPAAKQMIEIEVLDSLLNSLQSICQSFMPVITTVASGMTSFEEVLKKIKSAQRNNDYNDLKKT